MGTPEDLKPDLSLLDAVTVVSDLLSQKITAREDARAFLRRCAEKGLSACSAPPAPSTEALSVENERLRGELASARQAHDRTLTEVLPENWSAAKMEARALMAEELLASIGRRARSDGNRTFDDCIRDLGWIDDQCRALLPNGGSDEG